ncbi:MAG TPA: hypothetical protein VGE98_01325, partial [Thermoanaerobaculia bacterium]
MPDLAALGRLLATDGPPLVAAARDLPHLGQPVGSDGYTLGDFTLPPAGLPLAILGSAAELSAGATVKAAIRKAGDGIAAFAPGETLAPPAGASWTELELHGSLSAAGGAAAAPNPMLRLSLGFGGDGELTYRHLLPAPAATTRAEAVRALVAGTRPPSALDPAALADGEVHEMVATMQLSLSATAVLGPGGGAIGGDLLAGLFGGLAQPLTAHWNALATASLGAALYEQVRLSAGRTGTLTPGRLRLRCAREREQRLTLAALFELELRYDLASALEGLLAQALGLLPSRAIASLRELLRVVADGGWSAVKARLSALAAATIGELLDDPKWLDPPTDAARMAQLLLEAQAVVRAYDGLGERLQSLWDRLLGRIDLGSTSSVRALLAHLQAIDPAHPEALFGDAAQELQAAVEVLGGASVEQLLLGGQEAEAALASTRDLAARALAVLDGLPPSFVARFDAFAKATGVAGTVAWLTAHGTSVDQLRHLANARVQALVERLFGKALADLQDADLPALRAVLDRVAAALADPAAAQAELGQSLDRLRGRLGFSCALEI